MHRTVHPALLAFFCRRSTFLSLPFSLWLLAYCTLFSVTSHCAEIVPGSYAHGEQLVKEKRAQKNNTHRATGIILFVGDGMSITTATAARIRAGQLAGSNGEEHALFFETLPNLALSKTYNTNQQTPDSAGTMTAMITGAKTKAGLISVDQRAKRADPAACHGYQLPTLLELAEAKGWATGIVTTTTITHATPSAAYAHSPERNWESDSDLSSAALAAGCVDIAAQLIAFEKNNPDSDGIEVILGGGRANFLPNPKPGTRNRQAKRNDGRNLIDEWRSAHSDGRFLTTRDELREIDTENTEHLFGLFSTTHLNFSTDRERYGKQEPSLSEMVETALTMLNRHKRFLLIVEAGRIDHAHHAGNAYRALEETIEMDRAIQRANAMTSDKKTLIVVTADHSHTLTMAGYPTRGNPILGFVQSNDHHGAASHAYTLADDKRPYTTLGYANGRGYSTDAPNPKYGPFARMMQPINAGRHAQIDDDAESPNYHQEANVPMMVETHGGDDVAIYAQGPWSHLLNGVVEQNFIFHVMKHAGRL